MQAKLLYLLVLGFAGLASAANEYSDDNWANSELRHEHVDLFNICVGWAPS